jgi:ABC-2 type transport system ATP-binding protein
VQRVSSQNDRVTMQTTGRLAGLLRVIADHDPLDVIARHADLDELFLSYYREEADSNDG